MYLSHLSKCYPSNHTYLAYPYLHYQQYPSTPTMFQYLVHVPCATKHNSSLHPTHSTYSYYHATCLLRPCSFLNSSPDSFSIYCLTPRNPYLQYRLGFLPRQPNGTITFLRNNNQFYPSTIPILSLV